jgi:hypothetical protein
MGAVLGIAAFGRTQEKLGQQQVTMQTPKPQIAAPTPVPVKKDAEL